MEDENDDLLGYFGKGRRRRRVPHTSSSQRQPQYAIIFKHRDKSSCDSTSTPPIGRGSLVKITCIPINDEVPRQQQQQQQIIHHSGEQSDYDKNIFICHYEDTNHTEIVINNTKLHDDLSYEEKRSHLLDVMECCFPSRHATILSSDDDDSCVYADANLSTAFGSGDTIHDLKGNRLQDQKSQKPLRRVIVQHINPGENTSQAPNPDRSATSDFITLLPTSTKKIPLISITLSSDGPDSSESTTSSAVITDALLRACVKRLLVGRTLLHSELWAKSRSKEKASSSDKLSFRTRLSVHVPQQPSSVHKGLSNLLEFWVTDIQYAGSQSATMNVDNAQHPTLFVILPSTRIIFQSCDGEKEESIQSKDEKQQLQCQQSITQIPPLPSDTDHTLFPPHQHLVESLRSIIFFQALQGGRPSIPRSFLFSGPPGVGKTFAVKKAIDIANSWLSNISTATNGGHDTVRLVSLRGSEIIATTSPSGGNYATGAKELERQFQNAVNLCSDDDFKAVVVFLDECDALVSSSIVAAMLAVILDKMDGVIRLNNSNSGWQRVIVVAATNRVDAIPGFLRRPGRLEKEVVVSPPNIDERYALLKNLLGSSAATVGIDEEGLQKIAEECVGYVAADLSALVRRAAIICIERQFHENEHSPQVRLSDHPVITTNDLYLAMSDVGASCLRDASLSAPPKTTWDDIAGDAGGAKQALREAIEWPRTRRSAFKALGLSPPRGVLLHGPPGCAKTTLAKAAAGAAGVAFLSLSPADVYASSYVGEAEGVVRRAFDLARSAAPCVLFFDEIDAIIGGDDEGGGQGHGMGRGTSAEARVLSTFLNEMDGVDGSVEDGVLVLGATNRPCLLDAALLRPGRFDRVIYVPPPDELGRKAILAMECKKWYNALLSYTKCDDQRKSSTSDGAEKYFDVDHLASDAISCSMTGAELVGACRETAVQVMQILMQSNSKAEKSLSNETAERLMQSLMKVLESTLFGKRPLLSNPNVLEEYTRFEAQR